MIYKPSPRSIPVRIKKSCRLCDSFFYTVGAPRGRPVVNVDDSLNWTENHTDSRAGSPRANPYNKLQTIFIFAKRPTMNDYFVPKMRSPASPKPGTM